MFIPGTEGPQIPHKSLTVAELNDKLHRAYNAGWDDSRGYMEEGYPKYAWYGKNHPVTPQPNPFGGDDSL